MTSAANCSRLDRTGRRGRGRQGERMPPTAIRSLRLLTLAACVAAFVPRVAHRGMFVDGVTYASVARNLAEGRGRFWAPSYTATLYPEFYEHPPLGFWLQSRWFRLLGDH